MRSCPAERENGHALRLLILGGTTEASHLARALVGRSDAAPLLSFAGRTDQPVPPPIPHRVGGFGGAGGLAAFLHRASIDAVVDATHPFAAQISANAVAACRQGGVPLVVYTRAPWVPAEGDEWHIVPTIAAAVRALDGLALEPADPRADAVLERLQRWLTTTGQQGGPLRVFLTTGRLDLSRFRAAPQHTYLVRTIEPPDPSELPAGATIVRARPPFTVEAEIALMRHHGIELLVTKNSGGSASAAKLAAARALGIPVLMVDRPPPSGARQLVDLPAVLAWIAAQRPRP